MKSSHLIVFSFIVLSLYIGSCSTPREQYKVWEKVEIELLAENTYKNPYADVEVWVDLKGPDFNKRCYGFWDGYNSWKIRIMAKVLLPAKVLKLTSNGKMVNSNRL